MPEMNFCPYCDAPRHKISVIKDDLIFCKSCNTFFELSQKMYQCFKCDSVRFENSDFPSPDGELVLQCRRCKKMFSISDFLRRNEEVN